MRETPTITSSSYTSNTIAAAQASDCLLTVKGDEVFQKFGAVIGPQHADPYIHLYNYKETDKMAMRIVKVFIVDTNENVPLENRVLYKGEEKLTDLNDQELFFELPVNDILAKYNEYRKTVVDKTKSATFGKEIRLEPVKIRELKMTVLNVATF